MQGSANSRGLFDGASAIPAVPPFQYEIAVSVDTEALFGEHDGSRVELLYNAGTDERVAWREAAAVVDRTVDRGAQLAEVGAARADACRLGGAARGRERGQLDFGHQAVADHAVVHDLGRLVGCRVTELLLVRLVEGPARGGEARGRQRPVRRRHAHLVALAGVAEVEVALQAHLGRAEAFGGQLGARLR